MIYKFGDSTYQDELLGGSAILLEICCGLIQYDPVTSEVTLAHSSIKAFLTSKWTHSSTAARFMKLLTRTDRLRVAVWPFFCLRVSALVIVSHMNHSRVELPINLSCVMLLVSGRDTLG